MKAGAGASVIVQRMEHQGQPQPTRRLDLPHARHAILRADAPGGDVLTEAEAQAAGYRRAIVQRLPNCTWRCVLQRPSAFPLAACGPNKGTSAVLAKGNVLAVAARD